MRETPADPPRETAAGDRAFLRAGLFDDLPSEVAIIDRTLRLVDNNRASIERHGGGLDAPCYQALRDRNSPCRDCPAARVFAEGRACALETSGRDRDGRASHVLLQLIPLRGPDGEVTHLAELAVDLTAARRLQREYQTLFEKTPCYVCVLNRELRVVKANEQFRAVFGAAAGEPCHAVYKRSPMRCTDCAAERVFADGVPRTTHETGVTIEGRSAHCVVSTAPLLYSGKEVTHVIQISRDVTELDAARQELERESRLREALVEISSDAIVVLDEGGRIRLFNRAAEALWGMARARAIGRVFRTAYLEVSVTDLVRGRRERFDLLETRLLPRRGEPIPVLVSGVALRDDAGAAAGAILMLHDLRPRRQPFRKLSRPAGRAPRAPGAASCPRASSA